MGIHRWIEGAGEDALFVFNLQEFNRFGYRIGFPSTGRWREIFNSDFYDQMPNPNIAGNGGSIFATGHHGTACQPRRISPYRLMASWFLACDLRIATK